MGEAHDTAVDVCEGEIRRRILSGALRAGDRLPPERALSAELGVNRTTLRSALTRLVRMGLLRVRQGSGYLVQDCLRAGGVELVGELARSGGAPIGQMASELLEIRRALVRIALFEIASGARCPSEDVARAVERFGELLRSGASTETLAAADEATFAALFATAPVVALTFNGLAVAIRTFAPLRDALYADASAHLAVAWMLARWSERPSIPAIGQLLAEMELCDRAALSRIAAAPESTALDGTDGPARDEAAALDQRA